MQTDMHKDKSGHAPGMGGKVEPSAGPAPRTYRGSPLPLQRFFGLTAFFRFRAGRVLRRASERVRAGIRTACSKCSDAWHCACAAWRMASSWNWHKDCVRYTRWVEFAPMSRATYMYRPKVGLSLREMQAGLETWRRAYLQKQKDMLKRRNEAEERRRDEKLSRAYGATMGVVPPEKIWDTLACFACYGTAVVGKDGNPEPVVNANKTERTPLMKHIDEVMEKHRKARDAQCGEIVINMGALTDRVMLTPAEVFDRYGTATADPGKQAVVCETVGSMLACRACMDCEHVGELRGKNNSSERCLSCLNGKDKPSFEIKQRYVRMVEQDVTVAVCERTVSTADDVMAIETTQDMGRVLVMQDEALPVGALDGMLNKFVKSESDALLGHATMCKAAEEHDKAYIGADFGLTPSKTIIYGKPHESSSRPDAVLPSCEIGAKNGCNGMCEKCNGSKLV